MVKQIIIVRKDLKNTKGEKIRTGKYIAQAGHAIMGSVLRKLRGGQKFEDDLYGQKDDIEIKCTIKAGTAMHLWITDSFKKITLKVNSEEELLAIHEKIEAAGYESTLIVDRGLTEFGGVPTPTCIGVEPLFSKDIDKLTNGLSTF